MKLRGINTQLLLTGILPALIVAIILLAWFVSTRIAVLEEHREELGVSLVNQLAPASEFGIFTRDRQMLQRLADAALQQAELQSVTIRDQAGVPLARAEREQPDTSGAFRLSARIARMLVDPESGVAFTADVVPPVTDLGEFDLPADETVPAPIGRVEIVLPLLPAVTQQASIVLTASLLLIIGLLVSIAMALFMGRHIGRPILELADMIRRFRAGDLSARARVRSHNELGLLETGLNRMADEVQRTQHSLQDQVRKATAELTETLEAMEISNVELDLARSRALEASNLKSEFLASMSHEIRTPMSSVLTYARMLSRTALTPEQRDQVNTIERSAQSLVRLLNDILDLSKIEAGKLALEEEPFRVRDCIDEPLSLLAPLAYERGLTLSRCVHADVPRVMRGDQGRIQQVLTNLVSNAVKYTDEGGVRIEVHHRPPDVLHITVQDTGRGISEENQRRLFQDFAQPHESPDTHIPGSGLGLVICSRLVDAMNGEIDLQSAPGRGTTVRVDIRLDPDASLPGEASFTGRRVLLCEPEPLTRAHLTLALGDLGLEVESSGDRDALDASTHDLWIIGLTDAETRSPGVFAAHLPKPHCPVLYLVDSIDPSDNTRIAARLGGRCLPRCMPPGALPDALASLLDGDSPAPAARADALGSPLDGTRVLVTDDNRIHRTMLARQLAWLGAQVTTAADGREAINACERMRFDAVVLDLQMPELDGFDTARTIRELDPRPRLVAVTADAMQEFETLRQAGFDDYLVKPVDEPDLVTLFRHARLGLDREIREMLVTDLPEQYARLRDAVQAGDTERARAALHDLAGTAAICRLHRLAHETERLREAAAPLKVDDLDGMQEAVDEIMAEIG